MLGTNSTDQTALSICQEVIFLGEIVLGMIESLLRGYEKYLSSPVMLNTEGIHLLLFVVVVVFGSGF